MLSFPSQLVSKLTRIPRSAILVSVLTETTMASHTFSQLSARLRLWLLLIPNLTRSTLQSMVLLISTEVPAAQFSVGTIKTLTVAELSHAKPFQVLVLWELLLSSWLSSALAHFMSANQLGATIKPSLKQPVSRFVNTDTSSPLLVVLTSKVC
jgi:hypothetical protein